MRSRVPLLLCLSLLSACTAAASIDEGSDTGPLLVPDAEGGEASIDWREGDADGPVPVSLTASDGTGLQLLSFEAKAVLEDPLALTELELTFRNPENRVREGRFEINLPPGAAISRFSMKVDGQWQEAEVVERQAARRAYEDFLHRKQDPALLEKKAGNQFRARVFPIPAKGIKEIKVAYSQELNHSAEPYRLLMAGLPRMDEVDVDVAIRRPGGGALQHLTVKQEDFAPRGDLELRREGGAMPSLRALRNDDLVVARFAPKVDIPEQAVEGLTVLFDTSASRALGYEASVECLSELVASLVTQGDFPLQVVAFDQGVKEVYRGPASAAGNLPALRSRKPLGASDPQAALEALFELGEVQPRVLMVSDGIVTVGENNDAELVEALTRLRAHGVERFDALVDGGIREDDGLRKLAAGGGTGGLAYAGVVADARMTTETLVRKLTSGTVAELKIEVPGAEWNWPRTVEGVQPGDEVLVYAKLSRSETLQIRYRGDAGAPKGLRLATQPTARPLLERSLAAANVARLESQLADLSPDDPGREGLARQVVDLSVRKRVLSDLTALLVLETDADYDRFGIDRNALAQILSVGPEGVRLMDRKTVSIEEKQEQGQRHKGEEGKKGKPTSKSKSGLYALRGPRDASPQMARNFEPEGSAAAPDDFVASPDGGAFALGNDDQDVWGGLTGTEIGEAYGRGGLGLTGSGRGGGGSGEGTIGLGNQGLVQGLVGRGGGGGDESGYGRGAGAGFGGRGRRVPRVRQARAQVIGSMDRDLVRRVVRAHINEVRACYNQGLTTNPNLSGRVKINFVIAADGKVRSSVVQESSLEDRSVGSCVANAAKSWRFPQNSKGGNTVVSYPFIFSPGDGVASGGAVGGAPPREQPREANAWTGRYAELMKHLEAKRVELAWDEAWQWRENEPGSQLALLALGEVAEAKGDWETAERAYASLIDLFPSRADIRRMAGGRLERVAERGGAGASALALDSYRIALEQRPDHPSSHRKYAYALASHGQYAEALGALLDALERQYPGGRFAGVRRVLQEDAALMLSALQTRPGGSDKALFARAKKLGIEVDTKASTRFVLSWETDANDVDFHIFDAAGGHAYFSHRELASGGQLYADVTTGYGPECFTIEGKPSAYPYTLQAHYYSMGPMGYGMGKLQVVEHDGQGGLTIRDEPFVIMQDGGYVNLGTVEGPLKRSSRPS